MPFVVFKNVLDTFSLAYSLVVLYAFVGVLPMRRRRLFVVLFVAGLTVVNLQRRLSAEEVGSPWWTLFCYGLPLLFWEARPLYRAIASVCVLATSLIGEVMFGLLWILVTGTPNASYAAAFQHPVSSIAMRCALLAVLVLAAIGLRRAGAHFFQADGLERGRAPLAMLLALQVVLVEALMVAALTSLSAQAGYYALLLVAGVACLAADALLFGAMTGCEREAADRARADALQRSLDDYLKEEALIAEASGSAARVRHDVRNHLQVIGQLVERGELGAARDYAGRAADVAERAEIAAAPQASGAGASRAEGRGDGRD